MRTKISNKKRDGFAGELLISIPQNVLAGAIQKGQILPHQLYVSHIGYFPKALYHYCQRPQGCVDNILFYCVQGKGYYTLAGHTFTLNQSIRNRPCHRQTAGLLERYRRSLEHLLGTFYK